MAYFIIMCYFLNALIVSGIVFSRQFPMTKGYDYEGAQTPGEETRVKKQLKY